METVIIAGAGLSGATIARLFAEEGKNVIIYDTRENFGGNAYDYEDKNGILVQKYGPHIFHTNHKEVFDFLSRFTEWNKYEHRVVAKIKHKFVPVPFNLTSLETLYPKETADEIKNILLSEVGENKKVPITTLSENENPEIRKFANFVFENIFYKYSKKQWGMEPELLGTEVFNRVPVYVSRDDRYFTDEYQFMPKKGFTEMISNILRHPKIQFKLKTDVRKDISLHDGTVYYKGKEFDGEFIFTGRVDELFDYKFGTLPYRSLKFKFKTYNKPFYQGSAVVNYTVNKKYTRISEFSRFACPPKDKTVIVKEYPKSCSSGDIPYYPVPTDKNAELYEKYFNESKKYKNLHLLGRLAEYKYINMDVAVLNAFNLKDKLS